MLRLYRVSDTKTNIYDVYLNDRKAELMEARASAVPYGCHWPGKQRPEAQTRVLPFVRAQADERVEVRVNAGAVVKRALVKPFSAGVSARIDGGEVRFTLPKAGAYTLEMDARAPLILLISPIDDFNTRGEVISFGAGVHKLGRVMLKSNQTIYIDAEAVVYASFVGVNVENVRIVGGGVIDASHEARTDDTPLWFGGDARADELERALARDRTLMGGARFYGCRNVEISGVTFKDACAAALACVACRQVNINNVNILGLWKYDARGICVINSADVRVEGGFVHTFGDCVTVRGLRPFEAFPCERVSVKRVVAWCDWGCALGIGAQTHAEYMRDIMFEDCDLIRGAHSYMEIRALGEAEISRVNFINIRAEYPPDQRVPYYQTNMQTAYRAPRASEITALANTSIYFDPNQPLPSAHGEIRDVRLRDISVMLNDGALRPEIRFSGLDGRHMIRNCAVERLYVNGARTTRLDEANIMVNAYASKITFI